MWCPPVWARAKFKCSVASLSIFILVLNSFSIQELFLFSWPSDICYFVSSLLLLCCFLNKFVECFPWIHFIRPICTEFNVWNVLLLLSANFACIFLHKFEFRCMQIHPCIPKVGETPNDGNCLYLWFLRRSPEETARRLADTFTQRGYPQTSGLIRVKTESWSSDDGARHHAQKTSSWAGGTPALWLPLLLSCLLTFNCMLLVCGVFLLTLIMSRSLYVNVNDVGCNCGFYVDYSHFSSLPIYCPNTSGTSEAWI